MPISSLQLEIHLEMGSVNFMFETFENFIKLIFIVNVFKTFKNWMRQRKHFLAQRNSDETFNQWNFQ